MRTDDSDPIPSNIREFLDFYDLSLPEVQFPDVDQISLAALVSDVRDRAAEVAAIEARLRAAREALADSQLQLLRNAQRALAYARVYADGDPELAERIDALALSGRAPKRERRARTRRAKSRPSASGDLPLGDANAAAESAPAAVSAA